MTSAPRPKLLGRHSADDGPQNGPTGSVRLRLALRRQLVRLRSADHFEQVLEVVVVVTKSPASQLEQIGIHASWSMLSSGSTRPRPSSRPE